MTNSEPQYLKYLFSKAKASRTPISGTFEITSRCNLNCKMCYIHGTDCEKLKKEELTTAQWLSIADKLFDSGVLLMLITGGEPLLRPDFKDIYLHLKKKGFTVSVNTNGTLVNEETVKLFHDYPPARVALSIYGMSEDTYEKVTGSRSAFNKAINGALMLKEAGTQLKINLSITDYNRDDVPAIYDFVKKNNIQIQAATYMFPSARLGKSTDRCTPEQAALNLITSEKSRLPYDEYLTRAKKILSGIRPEDPFDESPDDIGEHILCRAGTAAFWITYRGELSPCGMMSHPKCSLLENSFEDAWKYIADETAKITTPAKCKTCKYKFICDACAASCFAETGSFDGVPEYQCKKAEAYYRLLKEDAE